MEKFVAIKLSHVEKLFYDLIQEKGSSFTPENGDLMFELDADDYLVAECIFRACINKTREDPLSITSLMTDDGIKQVINTRTSTTLSDEVPMKEGERIEAYLIRLRSRLSDYDMR